MWSLKCLIYNLKVSGIDETHHKIGISYIIFDDEDMKNKINNKSETDVSCSPWYHA